MFLKKPVWQLAQCGWFSVQEESGGSLELSPWEGATHSLRLIPGNRRPSNWEEGSGARGIYPQTPRKEKSPSPKEYTQNKSNSMSRLILFFGRMATLLVFNIRKQHFSKSKTKKETSLPIKWVSWFEKKKLTKKLKCTTAGVKAAMVPRLPAGLVMQLWDRGSPPSLRT